MDEDLYQPLTDTLARLVLYQQFLEYRKLMKKYEECVEAGGDRLNCWMQIWEPTFISRPPPPVPPEVIEAATYFDILEGMRANALETVEIIDGLLGMEPPF